jgi:hypothetical protein
VTVRIIPRAEWGARPPLGTTYLPDAVAFTIHWEGPPMGQYTPQGAYALVRAIQNYHMGTNGWNDIAYNFVIDRYGQVFEGRGWGRRSAANGTNEGNGGSIAVCYLGGQGDPFPEATKDAYRWLRAQHIARGGTLACYGHRHWTETACPGDEINDFAGSLHGTTPSLAPAAQPTPPPAPDEEPEVSLTIHTPLLRPDLYDGKPILDFAFVPGHGQDGGKVASNVALIVTPINPGHANPPFEVQVHNYGLDMQGGVYKLAVLPTGGAMAIPTSGRVSVVYDPDKPVACEIREFWYPKA